MKRFKHNILTLLAFLSSALILPGCADEMPLPAPDQDQIPDGITLRIPDVQGMASSMETRSETADLAALEGNINTLYLLMFKPGTNGAAKKYILDLNTLTPVAGKTTDNDHPNNVEYREYDLTSTLKNALGNDLNGTWNFYVAANIDPYITGTLDDLTDEAAMKSLRLNFIKTEGTKKTYLLDPTVALTDDYGLPMVAHTQHIYVKDKNGNSLGYQGVALTTSSNCQIHADLQFLCAKVRSTVFFNSEDEGFSKKIFDGLSFALEEDGGIIAKDVPCNASGLITEEIENRTSPEDLKYPFNTYAFPSNAATYPDASDKNSGLTGKGTFGKMAFQGTFYLPENASTEAATSLVFKGHTIYKDASNNDALTNGPTLTYTMPLLPQEEDGSKAIVRGMYYDIAAKITGVETLEFTKFEVADWTPKNLIFSLLPPTFLHLETNSILVEAGQTTSFWYDSNVEVTGKSPEYGGIPLYEINAYPGTKTITVTVNSGIKTADFQHIVSAENTNKYNWFYLQAGNIREKIDVSDLILKRFLTVDPGELTIDARDRVTSGEYSGERQIKIRTNVDYVDLTTSDWYSSLNNGNIEIWDGNTQLWTSSANTAHHIDMTGKEGLVVLTVKFKNINGGSDYWKLMRTKNFIVTPENDEVATTSDDYVNPESVKVKTEPNNDNFIIYFKPNEESWGNPHIYVYQCLELPGNIGIKNVGIKDNGRDNRDLSSMAVGYKDGAVAALEYSFTGAVAFKGWDTGANKQTIDDLNKTSGNGYINGTFYIPEGGGAEWIDWNARDSNAKNRYFKGTEADFCKEWRDQIGSLCSGCEDVDAIPLWPGIRMMEEEILNEKTNKKEKWYRFELSGAATPGKALIMFTDMKGQTGKDHTDNYYHRHPGHEENGIPLFDFPNRIGYYRQELGYWTNTPDGSSQEEVITNYTIKWPRKNTNDEGNYYQINISYEDGGYPFDFSGTEDWKKDMGFENTGGGIFIRRYNKAPTTGKKMIIKIKDPDRNGGEVLTVNKTITDASFTGTENYNGKTYRVLTLRSSDFTVGEPTPIDPPNPPVTTGGVVVVRVSLSNVWYDQEYLHSWDSSGGKLFGEFTSAKKCEVGTIDGYRYWKVTNNSFSGCELNFIIKNAESEDGTHKSKNIVNISPETNATTKAKYGADFLYTIDTDVYTNGSNYSNSTSYNNKSVAVPGEHNGWDTSTKTTGNSGLVVFEKQSIGKSGFKVMVGNTWYGLTSNNINADTWVQIFDNKSDKDNLKINNAADNEKYNVEVRCEGDNVYVRVCKTPSLLLVRKRPAAVRRR